MKTVLVTGCNGFIGQNLVKKLTNEFKVIGIDNFVSSSKANLVNLNKLKNFNFIEQDIIYLEQIDDKIDYIFNLACPASPPKYQSNPIFTLETNFIGTHNLLKLAKKNNAILIQASTSEVYGDPEVHPQVETYKGNVNTIGKRSCYDEGKRVAETLCYEYRKNYNIKAKIVRIFNTYGPGMDSKDGRVISNFMVNTINKTPLVIYGDGSQTRSFCFIDDMVEALIQCMHIDFDFPINLGNENEISLNELVDIFNKTFGINKTKYIESVEDDPNIRKPDISRAKKILNWEPRTNIKDGLEQTYNYFKKTI